MHLLYHTIVIITVILQYCILNKFKWNVHSFSIIWKPLKPGANLGKVDNQIHHRLHPELQFNIKTVFPGMDYVITQFQL